MSTIGLKNIYPYVDDPPRLMVGKSQSSRVITRIIYTSEYKIYLNRSVYFLVALYTLGIGNSKGVVLEVIVLCSEQNLTLSS